MPSIIKLQKTFKVALHVFYSTCGAGCSKVNSESVLEAIINLRTKRHTSVKSGSRLFARLFELYRELCTFI